MFKSIKLRLTGRQHAALFQHLYPGDGKEAVAIAFCGVGQFFDRLVVCVHHNLLIPYAKCSVRTEDRITWPTEVLLEPLKKVGQGLVVLKIHSHPNGDEHFSEYDDEADRDLFKGLAGWLDTDKPGLSAIMLPDGRIIARMVSADGSFHDITSVLVAGADIQYWSNEQGDNTFSSDFSKRTEQTFGKGTVHKLSQLSIGIVGVSGTGSPVTEMLARLGVGELVIVDGDIVKDVNLGRIYNSSMKDVREEKKKVYVLGDAIRQHELPVKVEEIDTDICYSRVIQRLAQCDIIFGCMDSVDGRNTLNKLCVYYSIPYFDLGVYLDSNGEGGVDQVCGTVHYLQPDGSSLFSRGVYTADQLRAADMFRNNPDAYREQVRSKYIKGINEDRPAVISVNTLIASLAINDFLARIHQYRDESNSEYAYIGISLTQTRLYYDSEGEPCPVLAKKAGIGDVSPLLDMPILSEGGLQNV